MLTFKLLDLKLADASGGREGLTCRFFSDDEEKLPKVKGLGDAVILRQIKIMITPGGRLGLSNFKTRSVVVHSASMPTPAFSISYQDKNRIEGHGTPLALQDFGLREQAYIIALRHSAGMVSILNERHARMSIPVPTGPAIMDTSLPKQHVQQKRIQEPGTAAQPPAKRAKQSGSFGPKFKLIEELRPQMFADVCGEVVKKFGAQWGCDLYITDYTSNDQMRYYPRPEEETSGERDGDTFGYSGPSKKEWPGPYEWLVLKVNLKYPHADYARKYLKEGDYAILRNVKGNLSREGVPRLEADLWPEYDNPEKIKISKLTEIVGIPEIKALQQRKEKYWASRKPPHQQSDGEATDGRAKSKEERKKLKRQEKKAAKLAVKAQEAAEIAKKDMNRNVRCTHDNIPITKVVDILDPQNTKHINHAPDGREYILPFVNARYRAKVRVVDYEPKDLEDFAVRPESEYDSDDSPYRSDDWAITASPSYEWYFSLLLEDASIPKSADEKEKQRIWVQVHHENAQFLLGSLADPDDLRSNRGLLSDLREKLFLLWGNLEEGGGGEGLSNYPFECIIMEYGIPIDDDDDPMQEETPEGWRRMYAMTGASIL